MSKENLKHRAEYLPWLLLTLYSTPKVQLVHALVMWMKPMLAECSGNTRIQLKSHYIWDPWEELSLMEEGELLHLLT